MLITLIPLFCQKQLHTYMRMSFRNFLKLDETSSGFLPGGRTTGLPLDSPNGWDFPDMHEPVTTTPRVFGVPLATSFTQASHLNVREDFMMKLNTLQRMANIVKSLVSYKMDQESGKVHTGSSVVWLDYQFVPPLDQANPKNSKIIGVKRENILSSGLQTHGLQINPAEIEYLERVGIMRVNPTDAERYDISNKKLFSEMENIRDQYQQKMQMGHGADKAFDLLRQGVERGGSGKLQLTPMLRGE